MRIQNINNNLNFGKLIEINCSGDYSSTREGQDEAIATFLKSKDYEQFGEEYNYTADFFWKYPGNWDYQPEYIYRLTLKLPDTSIKAVEIRNSSYRKALEQFIEAIKNTKFERLYNLAKAKEKQQQRLSNQQEQEALKQRNIEETIANCGVPIHG